MVDSLLGSSSSTVFVPYQDPHGGCLLRSSEKLVKARKRGFLIHGEIREVRISVRQNVEHLVCMLYAMVISYFVALTCR